MGKYEGSCLGVCELISFASIDKYLGRYVLTNCDARTCDGDGVERIVKYIA